MFDDFVDTWRYRVKRVVIVVYNFFSDASSDDIPAFLKLWLTVVFRTVHYHFLNMISAKKMELFGMG